MTKVHLVKAMVFPVIMYGYKSWTIKKAEHQNWCFWTVLLEKTLDSPLGCKEIKAFNPNGKQSWIFIGKTDAGANFPIFCLSDVKNWLIWKDPDARKDWRQEEEGTTDDEMVGWHYQLGLTFEQTLGADGQGSLVYCSPCTHRELDTTERLNWPELNSA